MKTQESITERTTSFLEYIHKDNIPNPMNNSVVINKEKRLSASTNFSIIQKQNFKNQQTCQVCFIPFGRIKVKQHHCRLCANAVCDVCSKNQIENNRVCDICFVKAKNMNKEKKRYELLQLLKSHLKMLSKFSKAYEKKIQKLDVESTLEIQKLQHEKSQLQAQKEKYQLALDSINIEVNENRCKTQIIDQQITNDSINLKTQKERLESKQNEYSNTLKELQNKQKQIQLKSQQLQILIEEQEELTNSRTLVDFHTQTNFQSIQNNSFNQDQFSKQLYSAQRQSQQDIQEINDLRKYSLKPSRSKDKEDVQEPFCKEEKCDIM